MMEPGRLLICPSKGQESGIVVKAAQKGQADWGTRSTDGVVFPGVNRRRLGRIFSSKTVRYYHRGMTREVCEDQLGVGRRRDNENVHLLEQLGHLPHRHRSRTVRLDIFNRWIEARRAKDIWPIVRPLFREEFVSTCQRQFVKSRRSFRIEQKGNCLQREIWQFDDLKSDVN